jgi:cytosine deaminase
MMRKLSLDAVALPGRDGVWDVEVAEGRIAAISRAANGEPRLALPAFADLHLHADRAYLTGPRPPRSLQDAVELVHEVRAAATMEDIRGRARRLLDRALGHGTLRARSHVDVDRLVERRALDALLAVREELAGKLDLELVAFATALADPASGDGARRLRQAVAAGADLVGTPTGFHRFRRASVDALLDIAAELGVPADVHVDETIDPEGSVLEHLAEATMRRGLEGRVTASHACVLAELEPEAAARTMEKLAAARITVIALPALNLYLQDRGDRTPRLRGLTLVRELVGAGVEVRFGSDNVRDVFYPYGDADPLESAFLASLGAHVEDADVLLGGITAGRTRIDVGDPADLVLVDACSVREAIARRPGGRTVVRGGLVVSA